MHEGPRHKNFDTLRSQNKRPLPHMQYNQEVVGNKERTQVHEGLRHKMVDTLL